MHGHPNSANAYRHSKIEKALISFDTDDTVSFAANPADLAFFTTNAERRILARQATSKEWRTLPGEWLALYRRSGLTLVIDIYGDRSSLLRLPASRTLSRKTRQPFTPHPAHYCEADCEVLFEALLEDHPNVRTEPGVADFLRSLRKRGRRRNG